MLLLIYRELVTLNKHSQQSAQQLILNVLDLCMLFESVAISESDIIISPKF